MSDSNQEQQTIKPIYISLSLIAVLLVLLGLTLLSESEAIKKNNASEDGFVFNDFSLKYPTTETFFKKETDTLATEEIVNEVTNAVIPIEEEPLDSLIISDPIKPKKTIDFTKIDTTKIFRIQYPDSNGVFLSDLKKSLNSGSCRWFHYGDSQVEGDRITSYLRNRLQGIYGGTGPGFIPIKQIYEQISANVTPSDNWIRYTVFDPTKKRLAHKKYGAFMSLSRFTPHIDSLPSPEQLDSLTIQKATINISKSNMTYVKLRKFKSVNLHYGNCLYPLKISVYENDALIKIDSLKTDGNYHNFKINLSTAPKNIKIELEGKISADFYGVTLDGNGGVQIDNVAMRGSTGNVFTRSNATTYQRMASTLNPKVVLMQFGGNAIPYLKDSTKVTNYAKYMNSQINWIKRRIKDVQILFIGPTDMVTTVNGEKKTHALLPFLNETLRQSCLENNVAYWSMFDAMGGKGSMKIWVDQKLAGNDYVHFTHKGTKIISELFFIALYLDLNQQ